MKKCSTKNLFILILILLLFVSCTSHEYYYSDKGRCVTVIKKFGAKYSWFVIPYKYESKEIPKCNYIEIKESSWLRIFWVNDSIFYINNYTHGHIGDTIANIINFNKNYKVYDINRDFDCFYNIATPIIDTIISPSLSGDGTTD